MFLTKLVDWFYLLTGNQNGPCSFDSKQQRFNKMAKYHWKC